MFWGRIQILSLTILLFTVACDRPSVSSVSEHAQEKAQNVVGGNPLSSESSLPHHVVLIKTRFKNPASQRIEDSDCTGVLVFDRFVLTAAHCVKFAEIISAEVQFPLSNRSEALQTSQIRIHSEHTTEYLNRDYDRLRDIALIKLNSEFPQPYRGLPLWSSTL